MKRKHCLTRPCANRPWRWEKIGDLQHLDKATTSGSSGHKAGGNTPKWEITDKGLYPGPTGYHTVVMGTHSTSFTPSQSVTETPSKATSTLPALHSFTPSPIRTNSKEEDVFPPFALNEKKLNPELTSQYCWGLVVKTLLNSDPQMRCFFIRGHLEHRHTAHAAHL